MLDLIKKIVGTKNDREIKRIRPVVNEINELEPEFERGAHFGGERRRRRGFGCDARPAGEQRGSMQRRRGEESRAHGVGPERAGFGVRTELEFSHIVT